MTTHFRTPQEAINARTIREEQAVSRFRLAHLVLAFALALLALAMAHTALKAALDLPETLAEAAARSAL